MPANNNDQGSDFASILGRATTPPTLGGSDGKDLPDGFPMNVPEGIKLVDTAKSPEKVPGAYEYDFTAHYKGFVVYRPWNTCDRCRNAIASGEVVLPDEEGDLECPHTDVKKYLEVRQLVLAADATCNPPQQVVLKDGTIVIALEWFVRKIDHKKRRAMRKGNMAAPPDGVEEP